MRQLRSFPLFVLHPYPIDHIAFELITGHKFFELFADVRHVVQIQRHAQGLQLVVQLVPFHKFFVRLHDAWVKGRQGVVADQEFFVQLLSGAQT